MERAVDACFSRVGAFQSPCVGPKEGAVGCICWTVESCDYIVKLELVSVCSQLSVHSYSLTHK